MKTILTAQLDPALWLEVSESLDEHELSHLVKAMATLMAGGDPLALLDTSGLRLAFALMSEPLAKSMDRQERNRANGAKGGRPRSSRRAETDETDDEAGLPSVTAKKSKKEDLSPTPPIEEKNKKNNLVVDIDDAQSREQFKQEVLNNDLRREQACTSLRIGPGEYRALVGEVLNEWEFADEREWSYKHLLNTLRIKVRNQSKPKYHDTGFKNRRDITDTAAVSAKDYEGPF